MPAAVFRTFLAKVSVFFLRPFFPLERRLFLPTAMIATQMLEGRCRGADLVVVVVAIKSSDGTWSKFA